MAANSVPPKKQGGKKQGAKNQGPKNQGPKNQGPKKQGPKNQGPKTQAPTSILMNRSQPPKKQGGKKQGGKKQGGKGNQNNNQNNRNRNQNQNQNQNQTSSGTSSQDVLSAQQPTVRRQGNIDVVTAPNQGPGVEALIAEQQQNFIREQLAKAQELEARIAEADNATRVTLGSQNLEGVKAQADATKFSSVQEAEATKFASVQSAEATKFAATEQARGSIETQRVASESEERQIGLRGKEERETNLQSELFRRFKEAKDQLDALKAFKA